ncbi:MAG: hypothetical protein O7H39_02165 [Gammaproteobacteria bacterium]|nr:hypothetical protein [Gammaproteobacteria bacterium]
MNRLNILGVACLVLLTACHGGNNRADPAPTVPATTVPDEAMQPATVSFREFVRQTFADDADANPRAVDAVVFDQDAEGDDFADLLDP